ncbi:MAG: UvrD-helicase domain-containing protein [Candidatus Methanoperedens sp.]
MLNSLFSSLKSRQLSSIKQTQPPHPIFAGAGTGKTTAITANIVGMVETEGIDPSHILALTFSREAARNMREKVEKFDVHTINEHLKSICDEGELPHEATIRKFRIVYT